MDCEEFEAKYIFIRIVVQARSNNFFPKAPLPVFVDQEVTHLVHPEKDGRKELDQ